MEESEHKADILVVDDTPQNLRLLTNMLKERGYKVRPMPSGRLALNAATGSPPDLILLDINMPEMNGYEVCERLKANPQLCDIPVLFVSALDETIDKVKAFSVGGVDYITKPFQFQEVEARMNAHLRLRRQKLEIERQKSDLQVSYEKLRELETLRDNLTSMIVHDMRSPLMAIMGALNIVSAGSTSGETAELLSLGKDAASELRQMVTSLLDISKLEAGEVQLTIEPCDLGKIVQDGTRLFDKQVSGVAVELDLPPDTTTVPCDRELVRRVIANLVSNAIRFTPQGGTVTVRVRERDKEATVEVVDTGPGIPPEFHEMVFEKFGQVEARQKRQKHSTGLGLAFCKLAVEAHGGRIGLESKVGQGSTFFFTLMGAG